MAETISKKELIKKPKVFKKFYTVKDFIALGIILVFGAVLAWVFNLHRDGFGLFDILSQKSHKGVALILWGIEIAAYLGLAYASSNNTVITAIGGGLGIVTRMVASFVIGLTQFASHKQSLFGFLWSVEKGDLWAFRLLAIVVTLAMIFVVYRSWYVDRFGLFEEVMVKKEKEKEREEKAKEQPKAFAFAKKMTDISSINVRGNTGSRRDPDSLMPPEWFVPVAPLEAAYGTVNIPREVIVKCVPEAKILLTGNRPVQVRLAYIVPQLRHATIWLTWQQIFSSHNAGVIDSADAIAQAEAALRDRWIKIPAKYYVGQVAAEFWVMNQVPPAWMRLPEVPQESEFRLEAEEHVG